MRDMIVRLWFPLTSVHTSSHIPMKCYWFHLSSPCVHINFTQVFYCNHPQRFDTDHINDHHRCDWCSLLIISDWWNISLVNMNSSTCDVWSHYSLDPDQESLFIIFHSQTCHHQDGGGHVPVDMWCVITCFGYWLGSVLVIQIIRIRMFHSWLC